MVDTPIEPDQKVVAVTRPSIGPDVNDACATGRRGGASLVSLPAELLALILTNLDHKHLLQCCIVCTHLRTVILGNVRLQYMIELAADGMVDGDSCALAIGERLQILRDQRARWRSAKWLMRSTVRVPYAQLNYLAYADGVLVAGCMSRPAETGFERAILCSMPSCYVGDHRAVPLALPAKNVVAVVLDPTQDLIILIGRAATGDQGGHGMGVTFTVYPRSISTSAAEIHPGCQQSEFGTSVGLHDPYSQMSDCAICGHSFGMSISYSMADCNGGFYVWDWTTGERLAWISSYKLSRDLAFSSYHFSFLLPDLILMSTGIRGPHGGHHEWGLKLFLHVFAIGDAHGGSPWNSAGGTIKHLVGLALPKVQGTEFDVTISTGPTCLSSGRGKPFGTTISSHIYRIDIRPLPRRSYSTCLVVHHDSIMRLASEYAHMADGSTNFPAVSWEKWGPDNTRMITHCNMPIYEDFDMCSPIHGERSITNLVDKDAPDGALHILDFNVHRPRPTSVDNDPFANARLISEPSTINFPKCFPEPVTTRLPYYSTPLTGIPDDHILAMDQDRIVAVPIRPRGNRDSHAMRDASVLIF